MSLSQFEVLSKLGEGAFSNVYKVKRLSDGMVYALKKVKFGPLKNKEKENALNEVRILASISSPNIIQYKEAFFDGQERTLCIVMEFAETGDLLRKISTHKRNRTRFPESELWDALVQITRGLKVLHDLQILHRDIKCANIFIDSNTVYKIADLNVSKVNKQGMAYTQTGTPYYASPEVWQDRPYNSSSDIWSLGCVVYEMAALTPPFTATDMQGLYRQVVRGTYPRLPESYSSDLANVVRSMLQVNPALRPSCAGILEMPPVLRHVSVGPLNAQKTDLLGTILLPYNINALKEKLPAAQYEGNSVNGLSERVPRRGVMTANQPRPPRPEERKLNKVVAEEPVHRPIIMPREQAYRLPYGVCRPPSGAYRVPSRESPLNGAGNAAVNRYMQPKPRAINRVASLVLDNQRAYNQVIQSPSNRDQEYRRVVGQVYNLPSRKYLQPR